MVSKILDFLKSPQVFLLVVMLLISSLGVLIRFIDPKSESSFETLALIELPVLLSWIIHLFIYKKNKAVAWGSGLAISLTAAYCNFVLLEPQDHSEPNIGLIAYFIGGFTIIFIPAGLIGGLLGYLSNYLFKKQRSAK